MFTEDYENLKKQEETFKQSVLSQMVAAIKIISVDPYILGNMVYSVCTDEHGNEVPAYCYKNDYLKGSYKFLPIYDAENSGEYGWSDFAACCRIFDVIYRNLVHS